MNMNPFIENLSPQLEFPSTPADNWNISEFLVGSSAENIGIGQHPIDAEMSLSHSLMLMENSSRQFLLQYLTSCGYQISRELKKKISNIRNKNTDYLFKKIDDKYVRKTFDALTKAMIEEKGKDDITKSLNYFFIQLALIRGYGTMESLYEVLKNNQTIKKNKRTKPCTEEQLKIISVQMQFYREVAKQFAQDPLKGVLKAYLRNHNGNSIRKGNKLDRMTHQALIQTLQVLNSAPFNYNIKLSLPEYQIDI